MEFIPYIWAIVQFIATIKLIHIADPDAEILDYLLSGITIHRIVLGSGWWILVPSGISVFLYYLLLFAPDPYIIIGTVIGLLFWHILFSLAMARVYGMSIFYGIFLVILPGISTVMMAFFGKVDYYGSTRLFSFRG